jgi:ubiquinone biosynthesis protein
MGLQMISRNANKRAEGLTDYERIRMVLEELGPTFVKMGQILSTRPDLVPAELTKELAKLQDNVPPFPIARVKEIIEQELRVPMDLFFARFDETPLAAASIGQVHRAQMITGEEVIVKVQRPGIRQTIETDIEILYHMATLAEKHLEETILYQPKKIVEEFARIIEKEINYETEARNAERFAKQFANNTFIYVPRIFKQATTERILTMEYIDGIKASDIDVLRDSGLNLKTIASRGAELTFNQIFEHGFFHADPHPGNICILPGNVICYLDFGMMDYVDRRSMDTLTDIVTGYANRNKAVIVDSVMRILEYDEYPDHQDLENDISGFIDQYLYQPLKKMRLGDMLQDSLQLLSRHQLKFPPDIFFMFKAMVEVEGIGRLLDPDFDIFAKANQYIKDIKTKQNHPSRFMDDLLILSTRLKNFSLEFYDLLRHLKQGKAKMRIEHKGLEPLTSEITRSSNRIASSLIIAALIIGSSLIITTPTEPYVSGFPLIGLLGYIISAILGLCLLISIWRSNKL